MALTAAAALFFSVANAKADTYDHHVDTRGDYCMNADDVTLSLSQAAAAVQDGTLIDLVLKESRLLIKIWDDGRDWAQWQQLTTGYTVDVSQVQAAVSAAGYPVTVTMPAITPDVVSQITFHVFVAADVTADVDNTPTPTPTSLSTPTPNRTRRPKVTPTPTPTFTPTPTPTMTPTPTPTLTPTPVEIEFLDQDTATPTPAPKQSQKHDHGGLGAFRPVDGALFSGSGVAAAGFAASIGGDLRLLHWYRKQRRARQGSRGRGKL